MKIKLQFILTISYPTLSNWLILIWNETIENN